MSNNKIESDYIRDDTTKKYIFIYISAERYLSFLTEHDRRPNTINSYVVALKRLIPAIGRIKGKDVKLNGINPEDVYLIKDALSDVSERTARWYLSILGTWIEYETGCNIVRQAKLLWNQGDVKRRFMTKDEFKRAYSYCNNDADRLIMLFGSMMGLRRAEIAEIKLSDIKDRTLTIHGKGHNDGKIIERDIPPAIMEVLNRYLRSERKPTNESDGYLLLRQSGEPLTETGVSNQIRHLSDRSGIRFSPHVLRRLYCMTLANDCDLRGDLDTLKRMMRHEDIDTTIRCYLDADPSRMNKAELKLSEIFDNL